MNLKCPACGTPISAASINVQQLVAVCPECDNVFEFKGSVERRQRKIKMPAQFEVFNDEPTHFHVAFKWSWHTEPPLAKIMVPILFVVWMVVLIGMITEGAPVVPLLLPAILAAWMSYILLTLLFNRTHYDSDGETLRVYTEPLPYVRYGKKNVEIDDIRDVVVERPAIAPFPEGRGGFYNVYVQTPKRKSRLTSTTNTPTSSLKNSKRI